MEKTEKKIAPEFLTGGGEMGEIIRNYDWANSPLGIPENWEPSLKTCVRIMLSSTQPIWLGWGRELIKLYNDPYLNIVRGKHPWALGQPASVVWKELWKDIGPALNNAMKRDIGYYTESQLLIMERSGFPEETYYTFSYTPVLGENGKPSGIICYNTADTERIINERALKTLKELDVLAHRKSESDVYEQTILALEMNDKDFPFAILHRIEEDGKTCLLESASSIDFGKRKLSTHTTVEELDRQLEGFASAVARNRMTLSEKIAESAHFPKGGWDVSPHFMTHVPINGANRKFPLAILTTGLNPYRKFDDGYRNFVQLVADQVSLSISNVIALEEERKRAKALEELDKAKTIFFSNISHEFRTPLTLMLGTIEEGLNDSTTEQGSRNRMEVAHRNALRLLKLVNTLLDFSRIESGRQKAIYALTDLASLTRDLAGHFRSVIEKAGLEFLVNTEQIRKPVFVDQQMWEKIVFNLLSNAFKYTLKGAVSLRLYENAEQVVLEVQDTGVGIPAEELPRMFERFHRVEKVVGRSYEGTGIGLSLIKELVNLHGGEISVASQLGEGSLFKVTIPLGKEHLPEDRIHETPQPLDEMVADAYLEEATSLLDKVSVSEGPSGFENHVKPKILVVDDNADMRSYLQSLLKRKFHVDTASNGAEAIEKVASDPPNLILSDIMMPIMDGIEMVGKLKENGQTSQIPVILLTARAGEESRIEGYLTGADDYLIKPFSANELLSRVRVQLDLSSKRNEVRDKIKESEKQLKAEVALRTSELEKSLKELESFNYVASHDLQEPLRKIQTFIALLVKERDNPALWLRYATKIQESSERMSDLINSLLNYSRISGSIDSFSNTDLNKILDDVLIDEELLISEREASFTCSRLPVIRAIPVQMHQLFSNLINNSIKFSVRKPVIRIESEIVNGHELPIQSDDPDRKFAQIKFIDNGIGFETQYKDQIFKLFQRLHSKSEYKGTGVGLSIVRKIVDTHGGQILAESTMDEGSTFTIWLPIE